MNKHGPEEVGNETRRLFHAEDLDQVIYLLRTEEWDEFWVEREEDDPEGHYSVILTLQD